MMMELSAYRDIFIEELNEQLERIDQSCLRWSMLQPLS